MKIHEFDLKKAKFSLESEKYVYHLKFKANFAFVALIGALQISTGLWPQYQGYILGVIIGLFVTALVGMRRESKA